jgi:flagellar capping protein FliD
MPSGSTQQTSIPSPTAEVASNDKIHSVAETALNSALGSADYGEVGERIIYRRSLLEERREMKEMKRIDARLQKTDARLQKTDAQLQQMDVQLQKMDAQLQHMGAQITVLNRLSMIENRSSHSCRVSGGSA